MLEEAILALQALPTPRCPDQSLKDILSGQVFFHLRTDLDG
jgi:hypothetical protein